MSDPLASAPTVVRVLVVEDDPLTREALLALLAQAEPRARTLPSLAGEGVGTLADALARLARAGSPVDVVLLDLGLPDADGLEAFERVRAAAAAPVVILTANRDDALAARAVREGAEDFLLKHEVEGPLLRRALLWAIERAARMRAAERRRDEQADAALGRLARGVAHEFNTLLTEVRAALAGAQDLLPAGDAAREAVRGELAGADHAVRSAAALTRQLLTFGRARVGRPAPVALGPALEGVRPLLERAARAPARLAVRVAPGAERATIRLEVGQLEQLLLALVTNARDAMPAGGTIALEADHATLDAAAAERARVAPGAYARLAVRDPGVGMAPEVMRRLFEPFFTTRAAGAGAGLGLATALGIATQAGGGILVESAPGEGSRFTVLLPADATGEGVGHGVGHGVGEGTGERAAPAAVASVRDGSGQPAGAAAGESPGAPAGDAAGDAVGDDGRDAADGRRALLLVEDDPRLRGLLERALVRRGYVVHGAEDGMEALDFWRLHREVLDAVVTDVRMPRLAGSALAGRLRAEGWRGVTLLVSGCADEEVFDLGAAEAADGFLEKPFTPDELAAAIERAAERRRAGAAPAGTGRV